MKARELALLALNDIEKKGLKSDHVLHGSFLEHRPDRQERALATELVNGVLRYRLRLDTLLGLYYHHNFAKAAPVLRNALRTAVYQLEFLDRIPAWAAINESVSLVRKYKGPHLAKVANGVLRSYSSCPTGSNRNCGTCRRWNSWQSHPRTHSGLWNDGLNAMERNKSGVLPTMTTPPHCQVCG
ncbi:transcription antitermination factor NusB [Prosthecochloris sp. HL-130-GSB]|uniref:transcription antitermination factor NusB n=1 Tax=Prosthecochloris sp. HL-130-GSB TaxID=1974213 RepID=UPI001E5E25C1|nr:transcription antitermination factor NusB [Prosthecochloris sp. HL-130-GSB]